MLKVHKVRKGLPGQKVTREIRVIPALPVRKACRV